MSCRGRGQGRLDMRELWPYSEWQRAYRERPIGRLNRARSARTTENRDFRPCNFLSHPYRRCIDEFIAWYYSEPRQTFKRAVVTRQRNYLESRPRAPGTFNIRPAAVRRLAFEAPATD